MEETYYLGEYREFYREGVPWEKVSFATWKTLPSGDREIAFLGEDGVMMLKRVKTGEKNLQKAQCS